MVIPRSRSRSIASSSCSSISRFSTVLVNSSSRSERVVLPWSMCAMMQKLRTCAGPCVATADSRWITSVLLEEARSGALYLDDVRVDELDDDDHDEKREVESAQRRDHRAHRRQHRLDEHRQIVGPAPAQTGDPRHHGIADHHQLGCLEGAVDDDPDAAHGALLYG